MAFLSKILLILVVFLIPLINASGSFGYEQIKVLFFILSTSLVGFFWLLGKPKLEWNLVKIASGVFILSLLLTSGLGIDIKTSLLGNNPYFQGWIIYAYLWLFSIIVASANIKFSQWSVVIVSSAVLVSLFAIKEWVSIYFLNLYIPTYAGRVVSTFGQPNFYAGFLLLTLPFSYYLFKEKNKWLQFLGWGGGIVSLTGIMVSYSRSTIFLALVLVILGLVDQLKIRKVLAGVVVVLVIAVLFSINFSSGFVWKEFLYPSTVTNPDLTRESVENRAYIWPVAWRLIMEKPVTGYGLENISKAFSSYFIDNKHRIFEENLNISPVLISLKELNIDRSHNYTLDLLLFSGGLGLLAWIVLVSMLFWKLKQKQSGLTRNVLLVSLVTYLVWVQFQNQSIVQLIYFWFLIGLSY